MTWGKQTGIVAGRTSPPPMSASLQQIVEALAEFRDFRRDDQLAIRLFAMQLEVVLMVIFRLVEFLERFHLGDDLAVPFVTVGAFLYRLFDRRLLLRRAIERYRAILLADIVALAIERGRIVDGEERLQHDIAADDMRIERDLHHFGMSRVAVGYLLVGRI